MTPHKVTLIVGAPRSGTSLLGDMLNVHPQVCRWHECYFVHDHYYPAMPDDVRTDAHATEAAKQYIAGEFDYYRRKCGGAIGAMVVDKSPRNSLKMPFLREIFPHARFIHILRDGRDTTLSINVQWQKRQVLNTNPLQALEILRKHLAIQPLLRHKIAALRFQFAHGRRYKQRWEGRSGWGPQFAGWRDVIDELSALEFNAMQWAHCTAAVQAAAAQMGMDETNFLEVRYEDLLDHSEAVMARIFDFLETPLSPGFFERLPALVAGNYGKWRAAFSKEEKAAIGPIVHPLLSALGYAADDSWYTS